MNTMALTPEQQKFAEMFHNLIYAFLNNKSLRDDEFYDIVVFGYLHAVQEYFNKPQLQKYSFTTIAWKKMDSALSDFYKSQSRQKRHGCTISLETMLYNKEEYPSAEKIFAVHDSLMLQLETEQLLHELASRVSQRQMTVIRMKVDGYGVKEIAREQKTTIKDVRERLESVYDTVLAVCCR
jgi:RNA polymerase sigma factor (sigma-70 family)